MNILAIGAHPDDVEFGAAPLLIKEIKKGNTVKILNLSKGEAGSSGTPKERAREAVDAAKLMGAEIEFLDFGGDCHIEYTPKNGIKIAKYIRQYKPNIILAPQPDENQHPDHSAAGKIVRDAARFARYGGLAELKGLPAHKIDSLYFYFVTQPFGQNPDIVVDASDVYKDWKKVMECHKTQMKGKQYLNLISSRAAALGAAIGTQYAVGLWKNDPIRLNTLSDITLSSRNY